uniref:CBS domain-containing protein n=1 Tax=Tetraselmis chuii TaxID=63592 RepID=A0A7S1SPV2_9CHLO|mmetsp:Transcript_22086/g.39431  ORF Transcript_22086/g.39431 Transcript_22086/m.39431 type:complete len:268 (+) Transcript_22086:184-987(+)|eukprot:CAMPEP_0177768900 /NCGR_PEP_ID=MMETSP0491_2-20121128/9991_1 /TAXON_ID=63592 /ORGANISM="Tetraselmis chuii, Strain PLY429" /LENGTH=267 /DNA_ID=CAMNT_0019285785 /DNA_START=154 /DNA_END=957 /DNA_ORIENTATION=-
MLAVNRSVTGLIPPAFFQFTPKRSPRVQLPLQNLHTTRSSDIAARAASDSTAHQGRAATDADDLKSLTGSLYDELRLTSQELETLDQESLDESGTVPEELWKVSKTCSVTNVMNAELVSCGPDDIIKDVVDLFATRSGLPVVTADNRVIGILSRKDVMQIKKHHGSLKQKVGDHMSSPVVTVPSTATAEDCAVVMLKSSVHRVPVVDAEDRLVGVASRSDLFSQLAGAENESEHVKRFAGDEDLMGSRYWKELHTMKTVDLDEEDLY